MRWLWELALSHKRLIFITGAEGSGTTLLRRLLAVSPTCASVGKGVAQVPAGAPCVRAFSAFNEANHRLWYQHATLDEHEVARADMHARFADISAFPEFDAVTHLVQKRSSPFDAPRGQRRPDLWDVLDLQEDVRVLIIYRDPCSATYSAFRRGFDTDLGRLARLCEVNLTLLASQAAAIGPEKVKVVSYRALCDAPSETLYSVADFCGLDAEAIKRAALVEGMSVDSDLRFRLELEPSAVDWLDSYFDHRRRLQWRFLVENAR